MGHTDQPVIVIQIVYQTAKSRRQSFASIRPHYLQPFTRLQ